ncbi:MAG: hypothetical protein WBP81_00950 [Solirubrobacteraceae bacterium]
MSSSASPRVPGLLALAGVGVVAGLASGRPELAVLAALVVEPAGPLMLGLPAAGKIEIQFLVHPTRWGAHAFGPLVIRARDRLG